MSSFYETRNQLLSKYGIKDQNVQKQSNSSSLSKFASMRSELNSKYDPTRNVDNNYINSFIADANNYINSANSDYNNIGFGTASSIYDSRKKAANDLGYRSSVIRKYLEKNKGTIDADYYNSLTSWLDDFEEASINNTSVFRNAVKYYSQWATEEDYNEFIKQQEDYDAKLNLDINATETEIQEMEDFYDKAFMTETWYNSYRMNPYAWSEEEVSENMAIYNELKEKYGSAEELKKSIAEKQELLDKAMEYQEAYNNSYDVKWGKYIDAEDWAQHSQNRNYTNPSLEDLQYYDFGTNDNFWHFGDLVYDTPKDTYGNELVLVEDENGNYRYASPLENNSDKYTITDPLGFYLSLDDNEKNIILNDEHMEKGKAREYVELGIRYPWDNLTEDEISMYYYVLNTKGLETALEFLFDAAEKRNAEIGEKNAQEIEGYNWFGRNASKILYAPFSGLDNWFTGTYQRLSGNVLPTNSIQYTSANIQENLDGFGEYAYQAGVTVGNMLPSILISKGIGAGLNAGLGVTAGTTGAKVVGNIAKGAGAIAMGTSAAGNAYAEAVKSGIDNDTAYTYGTLVGISESCLEYLIGGLTDLGGIGEEALLRKVAMIDSSLLRISARLGISSVGEIIEEELQNYLEPAFKTILWGEDYDAPTIEEILETAIVTAISTGMLESGNAVSTTLKENSIHTATGKNIIDAGGVDTLKNLAYEMAGKNNLMGLSDMAANVSQQTQSGKGLGALKAKMQNSTNAKNIGKLYSKVLDTTSDMNVSDVSKSLVRNGFSYKNANDIAAALVARHNGQELTKAQIKLLESVKNNQAVQDAVSNIITNEQSAMGQRDQKIRDFEYDVAIGMLQKSLEAKATEAFTKQYTEKEFTPEGNYDVSVEGKATEAFTKQYTEKEFTPEGNYDVSVEGKAVDTKSGETVDIKGVASIRDGEMLLDIGDGKTINAKDVSYASEDEAILYETVGTMDLDANSANTLVNGYAKSGLSADVYANAIEEAYNYGNIGVDYAYMASNGVLSAELDDSIRRYAYNLGRMALASDKSSSYNKTTNMEGDNHGTGEELYLRGGVQRTDSEGAGRPIRGVGEGTGAVQNGQKETAGRSGDGGKNHGKAQGQVSTKELGVPSGTEVRNLSYADETTAQMKKAKALAKQHGLELVAFTGGNLTINSADGVFEARAYICGNKVCVRADHPNFSLMQLLKHEIGHHKIRKGNVDMKKVYDAIADFATEEYVQHIIASYVEAYASLKGFDADYILEEILCDYEAGMNIFSKETVPDSFWEMSQKILKSDAVKQDTVRGPPNAAGKASADNKLEVGLYGEEGRNETRRSFLARVREDSRRVRKIGEIVYAYEPARALDTSGTVSEAAKEFRRLGITYFYHNGLEYNHKGKTHVDNGAFSAIGNKVVGIYAKAYGSGVEFAGHEAFHIWKHSAERDAYVDVLRNNINFASSVYGIKLADTVLKEYFGGDLSALHDTSAKAQFLEELYALVSGQLHSGEHEADLCTILKDYDAVKAAWDTLVASKAPMQTQNDKFSREVSDKEDGQKNTANDSGVQHQVRSSGYEDFDKPITAKDIELLHSIGRKSINSFTSEDIQKAQKWAYKFYKELGTKSPFFRAWFGDWRANDTNTVNVLNMEQRVGKNPRGHFENSDTGWIINSSSVGYDETISHSGKDKKSVIALQNIDKIIKNAILLDTETSEYGRGKKSIYTAFMHKFYAPIKIDGRNYIAKMAVDESYMPGQSDTNKKFYHVRAIEIEAAPSVGIGNSHTPIMEDTASTYSISDLYSLVKQCDKDFTPAHEVNPLLLNEDGTPKVFYHSTDSEFTVFDKTKIGKLSSFEGHGFYFFSEKEETEGFGKNTMECYLSMNHPFVVPGENDLNEYIKDKYKLDYLPQGKEINNLLGKDGYDGILWGDKETVFAIAFEPSQIKSATDNIGTFDGSNPDIRFSREYSYEYLTQKPDMTVTTVSEDVPKNRADVVYYAKQNAAKVGRFDTKTGSVSVHVKDINQDIILGTPGLKHSLDRRLSENAPVVMKAGEILQNSIRINELTPQKEESQASYVLIGAAKNESGNLYVVRSVVNRYSNELTSMDVLYAINAKKGNRLRSMRPGFQHPVTDSTISIADLLDYVNQYFPDVLPENVLKHYGHDRRPEGTLSESILYSREFVREQAKLQDEVNTALENENAKLREDNQRLNELIKLQRTVTGGTKFTKASVEAAARMLKKKANVKNNADTKALMSLLNDFYGYIAKGEELTWEDVMAAAQPAVDWLKANERKAFERDEYAQYVLDTIRGRSFYLDAEQKSEAVHAYGSYQAFRQKLMGTFTVSDNADMSLDQFWKELSAEHPYYFPADVTSGDQVVAILDAVKSIRNAPKQDDGDFGYSEKMANQNLLYEVYDSYWSVSTLYTQADINQRRINRLKMEHRQKLDEVKAENRRNTKELEEYYRDRIAQIRKSYNERLEKKQKETIDKWKESRKTAVAKVRETAEKRDAREKLQKLVIDTVKWISYPAKTDVKCPDILKKPYADFLNGIDMSSKRLANGGEATQNDLRLANAMSSLATALDKIMTAQDPTQDVDKVLDTGYLDLPANFVQDLRDMTEKINDMMDDGEYVVNNMSAAEVRQLSQKIRTLNHAIKTMSTLYANHRFANIEALGSDTIEFLDALGEIEKTSRVKDFVLWDNVLPYYAFKRFGAGGESVFEGLMDAQDKLAFLAQKIFDFSDKAWTGKEAKAWSEDTHTIDLPNGNKLTLTTADAMSIYCLSRREQGLQHLLGGGTRVIGIQKGSKKAKDSRSVLTIKDIDAINSSLTARQKQVAEAIQEFMSTTCSDWGNEISMKRFLTKEFNEKFYFPIESNDENLPTKDPAAQQSDLFRLLNISATKPLTPGANNEVIIRNIFDVFTGHASDMARLNAYGMAMLDYMKWLNYREKTSNEEGQIDVRGVRKAMEKAFGSSAKSYILNLVKDVNGRPSDGGDPNILMKWMRNAKTASVGNSLRVATLQITSYPRAALVLSPKSLALGLTKLPNIERAKKYCGIALWKSFGFYDTNISRSIEDQMKGVTDVRQKLIELSLKGAEWGDAITWGCLWNACEYEVAKTTKNEIGSEEFYQEVGKKLREVVYRTQVVDSILTRSQIMRSKRGMAQEAAAFMSEPTLSANILMDAGFQFSMEKRRSGSAMTAWKKTGKYIGKALAVYSIGQLAAALLEGLWDAWRDDDDEEFGNKYLDAFIENLVLDLVPFNKIPIVSDVFEAVLSMFDVGFYSSDKMSTTWLTQAVSAVDAWKSALSSESSTTTYNALYKTVRAISSFYGVSFSGVMREGVALWNNTAGAYDSTLKIRKYELSSGDLGKELYEAIIAGDTKQADSLKAQFENQDSMHSAVRKALRENDPRIKAAAQAQINGDPSERVRIAREIIADGFVQDDVVMAINAEINSITSDNGSTDSKKAKGFYTAEDFAREIANGDQAAANAAKSDIIKTAQKNGKSAEDAENSFNSSAKAALKEQFLSGNLSGQEIVNALTTYCGSEQDDAIADVQYWAFNRDYPDVYADDAWFDTYYENVADSGISIDVYMEYRNEVKDITGEGKKERRMAVIDSLPITKAQKDALYLAEGWSESKLYEAPWH